MVKKFLFVCIHNSARSQIAESYLNAFGKEKLIAESAGLEPGKLNPFVIEALKQDSIDISRNKTKSVSQMLGNTYDYVITVCDEASAEQCPNFPGEGIRLRWGFADPSSINGTAKEKLDFAIQIRDEIKKKIETFVEGVGER